MLPGSCLLMAGVALRPQLWAGLRCYLLLSPQFPDVKGGLSPLFFLSPTFSYYGVLVCSITMNSNVTVRFGLCVSFLTVFVNFSPVVGESSFHMF